MYTPEDLHKKLDSINGQDFGAYQSLKGEYEYGKFSLLIRQIPKDPYAPPHTGLYCIQVQRNDPRVINTNLGTKTRQIAFCDYLVRRFFRSSEKFTRKPRGTGYSGIITINEPGQCILERNAVTVNDQIIEVRFFIGLPAEGRSINAQLALQMFSSELPSIVESALFRTNFDPGELAGHLAVSEDADFLRTQLERLDLASFIADNALLPRTAGFNDTPINREKAVLFSSPESLRINIDLPNAGRITGMGIPSGVTLIIGGGYHGKSTLLQAIESGIYNHIPGDGREQVVSLKEVAKVRAYSGRYVAGVDISPFIRDLPLEKDTTEFSSENASGSTSQAAGIMESLELGARVLLMDEDTCATNFMIRDAKMQQLVEKKDEPITAFIDRVRPLYEEHKISTILVLGGAGDYFSVADHVIQMKEYKPLDVTARAQEIARESTQNRETEDVDYPFRIRKRIPLGHSIDVFNAYGKKAIYSTDRSRLNFGKEQIDLSDVGQLIELAQTRAIGSAIDYAQKYIDGKRSLKDVAGKVRKDIEAHGLDVISNRINGNFAGFRDFEFGFALNRLRGLRVKQYLPTTD